MIIIIDFYPVLGLDIILSEVKNSPRFQWTLNIVPAFLLSWCHVIDQFSHQFLDVL